MPVELFEAMYQLLHSSFKYRPQASMACIAVCMDHIRFLMCTLAVQQTSTLRPTASGSAKDDAAVWLRCAQNLARLLSETSREKVAMKRYAPYIVSEYVDLLERFSLSTEVQAAVKPGVFALINIMTQFELEYVNAPLNDHTRAIFKQLFGQYQSEFKFSGKV
eukprot:GFYU01025525.1.p2 GENE.GFYU01025525.1~~GFYU01025525.1.p2  ORF type:complete len:163 (+),score=47.50 GFYU01025525.1:2-490(+)